MHDSFSRYPRSLLPTLSTQTKLHHKRVRENNQHWPLPKREKRMSSKIQRFNHRRIHQKSTHTLQHMETSTRRNRKIHPSITQKRIQQGRHRQANKEDNEQLAQRTERKPEQERKHQTILPITFLHKLQRGRKDNETSNQTKRIAHRPRKEPTTNHLLQEQEDKKPNTEKQPKDQEGKDAAVKIMSYIGSTVNKGTVKPFLPPTSA